MFQRQLKLISMASMSKSFGSGQNNGAVPIHPAVTSTWHV